MTTSIRHVYHNEVTVHWMTTSIRHVYHNEIIVHLITTLIIHMHHNEVTTVHLGITTKLETSRRGSINWSQGEGA